MEPNIPVIPASSISNPAAIDPNADQKRRSSSRSIKRKRFDDEIVEYVLPSPISRPGRGRVSSSFSETPTSSSLPVTTVPPLQLAAPPLPVTTTTTIVPPSVSKPNPSPPLLQTTSVMLPQVVIKTPTIQSVIIPAPVITPIVQPRETVPQSPAVVTPSPIVSHVDKRPKALRHQKKPPKKKGGSQVATKDLGRWKPMDDLALIIGVQQTNDLKLVHRGTKFSCKFTLQELQNRWYSLLYEESISRISMAAMRNLHPEMVETVQSKALYTVQEEELLGTIKSSDQPTVETFQDLLQKNPSSFYPARTPKSLQVHWQLMKQYMLLPDQVVRIPAKDQVMSFSDTEELLNDAELAEPRDDALEVELALADRKSKKEIRHLENELGRWNVLVDSLTGIGSSPEFDRQTLAVLRGRLVRYLMRSREITLGRTTKDATVDVDLTLEGPAHKISRRQGTIKLRSNADFFITNEGKRPIFVDGMALLTGYKTRLNNNCVIEISGLRFIFFVNYDLINAIRQESAKMNVTLT